MEQLLDHLPTYTTSPCGGKFGLDRSYAESVLQRQKLCFIWCLSAVDGIQPCGGVLWGQRKLGKLAGDVPFQQLPHARCVMCSISLSMHSSLRRRNYCPALVIRKWRGSHLLEVTQVVKGRAKVRSYVRASLSPLCQDEPGPLEFLTLGSSKKIQSQ